ncbi:hypothetical protein [Absidia glauca]|uniref:Zn(2)-C6 fungal-type domain-containing protein n=1 Tax=Absidia glauca TaxID=4829 RepID=A0A168M3C3_ABSGL|nr:hypothetical protein [Absidia glauca]
MPADEKQPLTSQQQQLPASQKQAPQPTETRQKRAKIVSACSECRRKKTRCNGEQPCRNCQKSASPCVYPVSHSDDKRNGPSRAALEAIEERLQAIEEMLKTIVQSQLYMADLDPVAVNRFLNKDSSSSTTSTAPTATAVTSPTFRQQQQQLYISPSPQPSVASINTTPPTSSNYTAGGPPPPHPTTSSSSSSSSSSSPPPGREVRLPSIHSLSVPAAEHRDLPPLNSLHHQQQQDSYYDSSVDSQSNDRKRKR